MQITKEKLSYLIFLYQYKDKNYTITRLSQEIGVSKSTFSRVLGTFYQEGLLIEKGKGVLSSKGCKLASEYLKEINELSRWLKCTLDFTDQEAKQEALTLVATLSLTMRKKLISNINKNNMFNLISNIKEINGDMLSINLDDGQYPFAFTIYKVDKTEISMANDGFIHPGILEVKKGQGNLILRPREIERESKNKKMILRGKVATLKYQVEEDYLECLTIRGDYIIPINKLRFYYSKEERILYTSIKIKVKATVGIVHMPESIAILNIFIK